MEGERRTRPWASGRILTQAQRERKRERNRLSRRQAVNRARDRTAVLEESLRNMQALAGIDISGQQPLSNQDIQCPPALVPSGPTRTESPPGVPINNPDGLQVPTLEESQTISTTSSCPQTTPCSDAVPVIPTQPRTDRVVGGNGSWPTIHSVSPQTEPDEFFNNLLCSALHGETGAICKDEQINEDLLGRVILEGGWDAISDQVRLSCPLLTVLRYLDEAALQGCRPIDRLALLRAVHTMYLSIIFGRTSGRQELPPWYRSRPTQLLLNHSLIVNFVIWPGMRERLTLLGDLTALPGLWRSYINHFRFHWPGRLEDAFETNHCGDRYKLSGEFNNRFQDLHHWRMDTGFFTDFPAFVDDILPAQTIPQHLALWSEADLLHYRRLLRERNGHENSQQVGLRLTHG